MLEHDGYASSSSASTPASAQMRCRQLAAIRGGECAELELQCARDEVKRIKRNHAKKQKRKRGHD
eukprot:4424325-Pleurochrysis_carterae.AAC.1